MDHLYTCSCPVCVAEEKSVLTDFNLEEWVKEAVLKRIYEKFDVQNNIDPDLFRYTRDHLNDAVDKGFSLNVKFGDPDYVFLYELKRNNAVFAAFKTHRQQNDIASLLIDENGNQRSYNDFRKASEAVIGQYNVNWMHTEYTTAVKAARMAARFRRYMQDADLYPNLRWLPSMAADPREAHMPYYNNVRALSDPWWKTHYPGCVWGCQCDVENTDDEITHIGDLPVTLQATTKRTEQPVRAPGLDRNPAYTGSIFTPKHPYVTEAYPGAEKAVKKFISKEDTYAKR